jgi:hypothetical protein
MAQKTPAEIQADEKAASDAQREQLAREANKKRNDAMLEQRNAIADSADDIKNEEDDLEPLTDEAWDQGDRPDQARRKSRAERIAEQEEQDRQAELDAMSEEEREAEAAAELLRNNERNEDELDQARAAGADDVRKNEEGVTEYRVGGKWLTLSALRKLGGDVSDESDTGQGDKAGVKTAATRGPTPEQLQEQRRAEEQRRKEEREARKAKFKDLQLRASMGDEEAIDELADIQADSTRVTPEELERMVDQRVDARVVGRTAFDQAVAWFESDDGYAHELAAPGFKSKAAVIDKRLADEHPDWSPRQRLDATGKELRKELRELESFLGVKPRAGNGERRTEQPLSKLERKRQASDEVPRASGRQRPDVEPDEVETTQEAIQQLARARGQGRPITHKH